MIPQNRVHALQLIGGLVFCFGISITWSSVAVLLYGHRGNNATLVLLLACTAVFQIVAVVLLWRKFRFVALGGMIFILGEAVFVISAWLGLLWRR